MGEGQFVDISMTDGALAWNCLRWGQYIANGRTPSPGDDFLNHGYACYNLYETRDGRYMALGALEPQFWKAFCELAERPDWNKPSYFEPGPHQQELHAEIAVLFRRKTQAEWINLFDRVDCCCEPVLNFEELMEDPQVRARKMVVDLVHESWGAYRQLGIAPKFSRTPGDVRSHAPELGEHTNAILSGLNYSATDIDLLRSKGVV
jgi:crotonobetainyl-CoA:carnitine CoA-transferase CaiB-like acyl-CoA transferase